jgi:hypothetical protein
MSNVIALKKERPTMLTILVDQELRDGSSVRRLHTSVPLAARFAPCCAGT